MTPEEYRIEEIRRARQLCGLSIMKQRAKAAELVAALEQTLFVLELIIAPYTELPDAHVSDSTRAARIVVERSRTALIRVKQPTP